MRMRGSKWRTGSKKYISQQNNLLFSIPSGDNIFKQVVVYQNLQRATSIKKNCGI